MESAFQIRLADPGDSAALADLMARSPDAGRVAFTYRFSADLLSVMSALATRLDVAVATLDETPVGMIFGDTMDVHWSGARRPGIYVSNLRVHPACRRRGVARELARWGLEYVGERLGEDAVVYSAVMDGNLSAMLVDKLGFQASAPIEGALVPMRRIPPRPRRELQVRAAAAADWTEIAAGMNAFHADHNLWSPVSRLSLAEFVGRDVGGVRPNQIYVVTRGDELLGGLSVSDRTALVRMQVRDAPPGVRTAGRLLGILPPGGALEALSVRHVWFHPRESGAVNFLWQTLRFRLRRQGRCFGVACDPRDPVGDVYRLPRWLPRFRARYLVRAAAPLEAERPTYCIAGA